MADSQVDNADPTTFGLQVSDTPPPRPLDYSSAQKFGLTISDAPAPVPGMEKLGGIPPGPPRPQLRMEYSQFAPAPLSTMGPVQELFETIPAIEAAAKGFRRFALAQPTPQRGVNLKEMAAGTTEMLGGAMRAVAPVALPLGIAAAPLEAASTLALGTAADVGTEAGLTKLGVAPEYAGLAGRLAGLGVGLGGLRAVIGKADAAIEVHNRIADTLLEQERGKGLVREQMNDIFRGESYPIQVGGVNANLRYADNGMWQVVREDGKVLTGGRGTTVQEWLQTNNAKPASGGEPAATPTPSRQAELRQQAPPSQQGLPLEPEVPEPEKGTQFQSKQGPATVRGVMNGNVYARVETPEGPETIAIPLEEYHAQTATPAPAPEAAPPAVVPEPVPEVAPAPEPEAPTAVSPQPSPAPETAPARTPGWVGNIPTSEISVDAPRFQFKRNVGEGGAGEELRGVTKWDPEKAGILAVWLDPADGKTYVVNGHHRVELAQRTGAPEMAVRYLQAADAREARLKGALINIAEGRGESTDAAKVFRDGNLTMQDLADQGVSPKGKIANEGLALSKLAQPIFDDVMSGNLSPARGAVIGAGLENPADQQALYDLIKQDERAGKRPTNDQVAEMIELAKGAPKRTETQEDLFGTEETTRSLLREKAEVSDYVRKQLGQEKKLFGTVGSQAAAEKLAEQGNVIQAGANAQVAQAANQGMAVYDRLKAGAGPIGEALNRAAESLADGESAAEVKQRAYRAIRAELRSQVERLTKTPSQPSSGNEGLEPARANQELAVSDQPQPLASAVPELGESSQDIIRGSTNIPLAPQGQREATELAKRTAGQFSEIWTSPLLRAKQTTQDVAETNPQAGKPISVHALTPWYLGGFEGKPTLEVLDKIHDLIRNHPDKAPTGRGPNSTADGQSWNDYKNDFLGHVERRIADWQPGDKVLSVTHYRGTRVLQAWHAAGMPADKRIDLDVMTSKGDVEPGEMLRLYPPTGELTKVSDASQPEGGLYFARHGATAYNAENRSAVASALPGDQDLFAPEEQGVPVEGVSKEKLLGEQLTAQMKSGMAAKPAKVKPAKNRGLFEEEGPEQESLFARVAEIEPQSIEDIQKQLQSESRKAGKPVPLDAPPEKKLARVLERSRQEVAEQLNKPVSGVDWYGADTALADQDMARAFPELKTNRNKRLIQKAISAVLSPSSNPRQEAFYGAQVYAVYRQTGRIPLTQASGVGWPAQGAAVALGKLQTLIDTMGEQGLVDFLTHYQDHNAIREVGKTLGYTDRAVRYWLEGRDRVLGAAVLGPKVRRYFAGISGLPTDGTAIDIWMARAHYRQLGHLFINGKPVVDPRIAADRDVFMQAHEILAKEFGLTPRDIQSVLWHSEQARYRDLGSDTKTYKRSDGTLRYLEEEGINPKYVAKRRSVGPGGTTPRGAGEGAGREPGSEVGGVASASGEGLAARRPAPNPNQLSLFDERTTTVDSLAAAPTSRTYHLDPTTVRRLNDPPSGPGYYEGTEAYSRNLGGHGAVFVNGPAMDVILQSMGPTGRMDNANRILGLSLTPQEWMRVLYNARQASADPRGSAFEKGLLQVADAIRNAKSIKNPLASMPEFETKEYREAIEAGMPRGPLIVVQAGKRMSNDMLKRTAEEELDHANQMSVPGGLYGLPVTIIESGVGAKAVKGMVEIAKYRPLNAQSPFYFHNRAVMAAEVLARLMRPGRYRELGLEPQEARELAEQFAKGLAQHGDKASAIVDQIYETIEKNLPTWKKGLAVRQTANQAGREGGATGVRGPPAGAEPAISGNEPEALTSRLAAEPHVPTSPELIEQERASAKNAIEAVYDALFDDKASGFGEKLRTMESANRDVRIAETNQTRGQILRILPNHVDREALTLVRDFKNRPGELQQFRNEVGTLLPKELAPPIDRALNPTPEIAQADRIMTDYFTKTLDEGRKLGFLDSGITNDEYITHILQPREYADRDPNLIPRAMGRGRIGPRNFSHARSRYYPTVLHAMAAGVDPRTLDAVDALTIYGDRYAKTAAYRILTKTLQDSALGQWGTRFSQKAGKDPSWVEMYPESQLFRRDLSFVDKEGKAQTAHQMFMVPPIIATAMHPALDPNYLSRVPAFMSFRMYQGYLKAIELGMSVFHIKALGVSALGNQGINGLVRSMYLDLESPDFKNQELSFIRAGGTTPVLGRTIEAYLALKPSSVPNIAQKIGRLPVIKQIDQLASGISHLTFGIIQRKFKVMDFSLKDAAWITKHPSATPKQHFEAQRSIAKEINAVYGGLHWENMGVHRVALELSRGLFLAPDWFFSNYLNAKYAFEGGPGGNASRLFWIKTAMYGFALTAGMSLLLSGRLPKDPSQVLIGKNKLGQDIYQNMFLVGAVGDLVNLIHQRQRFGTVVGTVRFVVGKFGPGARTVMNIARNENERRQPIVKESDTELKKTLKGVEEVGTELAPVPFAVPTITRMLLDKKHHYTAAEYVATAINSRQPLPLPKPKKGRR